MVNARHSPVVVNSQRLSFEVLSDLSEVEAVAGEWDALLERSRCNRAFSSAAWYLAACRHNPAVTPNTAVARRGDELLGVLPLALIDGGKTATFPIRFSDYNDIVTRPEDLDVGASLLRRAISSPNGYQKLKLLNLRSDSNCLRAARQIFSDSEFARIFQLTTQCPYILLPSSYDEYLASRSSKLRKNLRRALREASRSHVLVQELKPDNFSAADLPEVFLSLQFNRKGVNSCFEPATIQSFVREAVTRLFREQRLRAFALYEKNRIIAIDLYMVGSNSVCCWNGGFLSEAERWSPVKLLNDAAIRSAFALGLEEYDYLRGEHRYKLSWTNNRRQLGELEITVGDCDLKH